MTTKQIITDIVVPAGLSILFVVYFILLGA